jgi:hypothetical protein
MQTCLRFRAVRRRDVLHRDKEPIIKFMDSLGLENKQMPSECSPGQRLFPELTFYFGVQNEFISKRLDGQFALIKAIADTINDSKAAFSQHLKHNKSIAYPLAAFIREARRHSPRIFITERHQLPRGSDPPLL